MKDTIGDCSKNKDIISAFLVPKKLGKYNYDNASCFLGRGVVYSFLVPNQTEYKVLLISIFDTENKENNWKLNDLKDGYLYAQKANSKGYKVIQNSFGKLTYTVISKYDDGLNANYYSIFKERYVFHIEANNDQDLTTNNQMKIFANKFLSTVKSENLK